jgi:glucose-6-phosphate isomerase
MAREDAALYEVYEMRRPPNPGDLSHGVSIVHPGVIGDEYFMTKGHYHAVLDTAEIYHCLGGRGAMVMETLEGGWAVEEMRAGRVVFVPPRWAHRTVNTGETDLAMLWAYPAHAGHDYGTIEARGFRKRIVARADGPRVIDNSRWCS